MIRIKVTGQSLTLITDPIAANSLNYLKVEAEFDEDWNGCTKYLQARQGDKLFTVLLDDNIENYLPLTEGLWFFNCVGYIGLEKRITTNAVGAAVAYAGFTDDAFPDVTQSVGEQLVAQMSKIYQDALDVRAEIAEMQAGVDELTSGFDDIYEQTRSAASDIVETADEIKALKTAVETAKNRTIEVKESVDSVAESITQTATLVNQQCADLQDMADSMIATKLEADTAYNAFMDRYDKKAAAFKALVDSATADLAGQKDALDSLVDSGKQSIADVTSAATATLTDTYSGMLSAIDQKGSDRIDALNQSYTDVKAELRSLLDEAETVQTAINQKAVRAEQILEEMRQIRAEMEGKEYTWGDLLGGEG